MTKNSEMKNMEAVFVGNSNGVRKDVSNYIIDPKQGN